VVQQPVAGILWADAGGWVVLVFGTSINVAAPPTSSPGHGVKQADGKLKGLARAIATSKPSWIERALQFRGRFRPGFARIFAPAAVRNNIRGR